MQEPDGKCRGKQGQRQDKTKTEDDGPGVLLLERVKEELVPAIDRERCAKIGEEKEQNGGGQKPRLRSRPTIQNPRAS